MIKINLVCVGKVKEKYFADGIAEYTKRLKRFCDFNVFEAEEENLKDGNNSVVCEKEGKNLIPYLKGKVYCFAIEGEKFSSEKFAREIRSCADSGQGVVTFVIGGSYGLSEEVKKKANKLISFSDMTFPHTLFRLIATEQIYRAFCIINGTPYHK